MQKKLFRADKVEEFVSHLKNFIEIQIRWRTFKKVQHTVQSTEQSNETEIQKVTKVFNDNVSTLQDSETK
ncbi:22605_t:CDS:2, partial [Gigaspora rosea]